MEQQQQQGIRWRFSHVLTSSIGMCRSKEAAESPLCIYRDPVSSLPSCVRKPRPRLADLFSADSDTTRCCEKFESDKTSSWSGSEADGASMTSQLSPFEYNGTDLHRECQEDVDVAKTKLFQSDDHYYSNSTSKDRSSHSKPLQEYFTSDSDDIASSVRVDLSQSQKFQESLVCSNVPEVHITKVREVHKPEQRKQRRRKGGRRSGGSCTSVAVAKRSVDPYEDFKRSMVEMIVEKEIFGREELEELLLSFLGLNSPDHHKIIVLVFVDILRILFSSTPSSTVSK